jgi:hypothetical protein
MSAIPARENSPPVVMPASAQSPADAVGAVDAAERLAASRQRVRQALNALAHPPPRPSLFAEGIGNVGNRLLDRIKSLPMATALLEGLAAWWRKHPLHRAGNAAAAASSELLGPIARRNPGAVLLIAVGSGILLACARPWRLLFRPATLFSAIAQIGRLSTRGPSAKAWKKSFRKDAVDAST